MKPKGLLLVEGSDDLHVISALLMHHNTPKTFRVEEKGGIENVFKTFPVMAKGSEVNSIGIVVDADVDVSLQWGRLKAIFDKLGYKNCPDDPPRDGLILDEENSPRVGVWLMPDNSLPGMLEDFIRLLVPTSDALWNHVEDVIENIPTGVAKFKSIHVSKAKIHTWLSWKEDPGTPMGLAITKKWLDPDADTAIPFMTWISNMFSAPELYEVTSNA